MMLIDVPRLYGADAPNVILHMDSASSHTSRKVVKWLKDHNIKFFTKGDWLID